MFDCVTEYVCRSVSMCMSVRLCDRESEWVSVSVSVFAFVFVFLC